MAGRLSPDCPFQCNVCYHLLCSISDPTSGKLPFTVKAVFDHPHTLSHSFTRHHKWQVRVDSQVQQGKCHDHRYNGNTWRLSLFTMEHAGDAVLAYATTVPTYTVEHVLRVALIIKITLRKFLRFINGFVPEHAPFTANPVQIENMRNPPVHIDKFRSGTIASHIKCQTRLIRSCTDWNKKTEA